MQRGDASYFKGEKQGKQVDTFEYNGAGEPVKTTRTSCSKGEKKSVEETTKTYDAHGGCTGEVTTRDGKPFRDCSWKHSYDDQGNRVRTVHLKDGKAEMVEVIALTYY